MSNGNSLVRKYCASLKKENSTEKPSQEPVWLSQEEIFNARESLNMFIRKH